MSPTKLSLAFAAAAALVFASAVPATAQYITKRGTQSYAPETTKKRTQGPAKTTRSDNATTQQRGGASSSSSSRTGTANTTTNGTQTQRR